MADRFSDQREAMPTTGTLLQMVTQNDEKHDEGHGRLRTDYRALEHRVTELEATAHDHGLQLAQMRATPVEASKLTFSTGVVFSIIATVVTLSAGQWASTYGLRSDVRDIITRMDAMRALDESRAHLQEERAATLRESIDAMKRRQELQQYEIQGLKETILKQRVR